ncbi:MAG: methionine--tRNA ligase [Candidatus Sungbacteria bacterium]|uniref:methionine--tRNA ligase n=1 Tax=Candidatus Sungiibacteriota bacterium TaxID=2750080 RepID=A0A9D6LQG3_9BACT|nr:methionine--tRNA ligase [Candidatus Sungbacteria bacterium]
MKPFFVTTPIYYVNDLPHIGHAYTTVAADVLVRFKRQSGETALLLVGTDEHGAKIAEAASIHNKNPKEYVDEIVVGFKDAWEKLEIAYDRFIRTTDPDHESTAKDFLQKLFDRGYITKGIYEGLYCLGHEKFMSPEELVNGICPDHAKPALPYKEENYFFKLSQFEKKLINVIESNELEIRPLERKNEVVGKLRQGLEDISISRKSVSWGIPLPFDPSHTCYVWIEALINYYTYGQPTGAWPADLHLIGKDILWFHAIVWPAMLLAVDEDLPKKIFAHGFFTIGGQKMSKTLGNVITPHQLIETFGVEASRYLLLSSFPFGVDGDFDWSRMAEKYNADLANGIGNAVSRITTLAVGVNGIILGADPEFEKVFSGLHTKYRAYMSELDFFRATGIIQEMVKHLDQYLNEKKPWTLEGGEKKKVLRNCLGMTVALIGCAGPFMPKTADTVFGSLGLTKGTNPWGAAELKIERGANLFPRLG